MVDPHLRGLDCNAFEARTKPPHVASLSEGDFVTRLGCLIGCLKSPVQRGTRPFLLPPIRPDAESRSSRQLCGLQEKSRTKPNTSPGVLRALANL